MDTIFGYVTDRLHAWVTDRSSIDGLVTVGFLLTLLIIDIARRGGRFSWPLRAVKGVFATLSIYHLNFLMLPLLGFAVYWFNSTYTALNLPAIPASFWSGIPAWALLIIGLLSYDFSNYWIHRLMHTKWFWPTHAIHHSDPDVNGLSTFRVHFLETVLVYGSYTLLLTWMGIPADTTGVGAFLMSLHIMYVHVDVDWDHGPFKFVFASPRFHRWHHADVPEAHGKNLANMFPFLDLMFGTYVKPGARDTPLGAQGVPQHEVISLMAFPFTEWSRMVGDAVKQTAAKLSRTSKDNRPVPEPRAVPVRD